MTDKLTIEDLFIGQAVIMEASGYTQEEIEDEFGRYWHDMAHPTHSKKKGHFCNDFDGLWICEDCGEYTCCRCFEEED